MNHGNNNGQGIDSLERDIDQHRANLSRTLDEVEQRFSPDHLMQQASGYLSEHGGELARSVGRSVKENPLPLMLTGIGISWLMASQSGGARNAYSRDSYERQRVVHRDMGYQSRSSQSGMDDHNEPYDTDHLNRAESRTNGPVSPIFGLQDRHDHYGHQSADQDDFDDCKQRAKAVRDDAKAHVKSIKRDADESIEDWQERIAEASASYYETMTTQMQNVRHKAQNQAQRQVQATQNWFQEQPLVAGALGVAAGALLGALLPSTEAENRMVGQRSDDVKRRAMQEAEHLSEQAKVTVNEKARSTRQAVEGKVAEMTDNSDESAAVSGSTVDTRTVV